VQIAFLHKKLLPDRAATRVRTCAHATMEHGITDLLARLQDHRPHPALGRAAASPTGPVPITATVFEAFVIAFAALTGRYAPDS
jgi:hypothetical protein